MLDQGDEAAGHEASGADGRAAARDLADLDHAAGGRHLDPPPGPRRDDLERLRAALAGVDDGLDAIAPHRSVPRA